MADNVLEPQTFSFGDAKSASTGCSSRVWVSPTSILQRKRSRCIYVCIACGCYEISQRASQIWKSFCDQDRPFSSFTWCGRLFFAQEVFELAIAASRASWYQLTIFESDFTNPTSKTIVGLRQNPIFSKNIALTVYPRWCRIKKFSWKKLFRKNRRWFIQYCTKPELLLPVLKAKSGSITS